MKSQADHHILTVCSLLLLTALACSSMIPAAGTPIPTATPPLEDTSIPPPTDTPSPEPTSDVFTVIYSDDFSDPNSGWPVWSVSEYKKGSSAEYAGGEYVIKFARRWKNWMRPDGLRTDLSQVSIEYTVKNQLHSNDLYFGVYYGFKDEKNYYEIFFHTRGYYRFSQTVAGEQSILSPDDGEGWAQLENITTGASEYKFRAECGWEGLVLYMDGKKIAQMENVPVMPGEVYLVVGTHSENGGEIRIDDFNVGTIIG